MEVPGPTDASLAAGGPGSPGTWLLVLSVPLLTALMSGPCRHWFWARCSGLKSRTLELLRGRRRVCLRSAHAFVFTHCTHGRADSVLETFALYSESHPSDWIGPETGRALDELVQRLRPSRVLELGTHCGYTSVRLLRQMPPTGRLLTLERDPLAAELGEEIIMVAGFKHAQFQVISGRSGDLIPKLRRSLGTSDRLDLVVMDHEPQQYLGDLLALEREKLLEPSATIVLLSGGPDTSAQVIKHLSSWSSLYAVHILDY